MQIQNYLGIYISKDTATVLCLGPQPRGRNIRDCFSVSVRQAEQEPHALASLIAEGCTERGLEFSEAAVALDCAMFMQHNVRSEFSDPKQIAQTIRFDTEQALATDITDLAIAFRMTSSDRAGSVLTVFTAQRKLLSEILLSLQAGNIDPAAIEPDVNCLSRFILQYLSPPQDSNSLFCVLSRRCGYFIAYAGSQEPVAMRTFLLGPAQDRNDVLAKEVPVTAALLGTDGPINCVRVFDSTGSVNYEQLSRKLGIEAGPVDLAEAAGAEPQSLADCADPVDFAIACGAALSRSEKDRSMNFRSDFNPYQGGKLRLQKALKPLSISVVALCLAVGLFLQLQLLQKNRYCSRLHKKSEKQYSAVMLGKKPPAKSNPVKKLAGELRRIRDIGSGRLSITGEESVSAKLTLVLEAFNKCAAQTDLNIDSIAVTTRTISIAGDTSSRKNTLKLFEALRVKLDILQQRLDSKAGRDNFHITVVPKK